MSRRRTITTKQIHANHWDNHEAVVIRSLSTDDEEHITNGLAGIDPSGQARVYAGRNKRLTLQRAIVSWTLTDEHGKPTPLSEDSIRELAPEDSQYIFEEIQSLNKPLTDQEKKPSTTNASSSTDTVESRRKRQ